MPDFTININVNVVLTKEVSNLIAALISQTPDAGGTSAPDTKAMKDQANADNTADQKAAKAAKAKKVKDDKAKAAAEAATKAEEENTSDDDTEKTDAVDDDNDGDDETPVVELSALLSALREFVSIEGKDAAKKLLAKHGGSKLSDIDKSKYNEMAKDLGMDDIPS